MDKNKLFLSICMLGQIVLCRANEIQNNTFLNYHPIVFLDLQAVGYSADSYDYDENGAVMSCNSCNTSCNTNCNTTQILKPGSIPGSLEWDKYEQLAIQEGKKYEDSMESLSTLIQKRQSKQNITKQEQETIQELQNRMYDLSAHYYSVVNDLSQQQNKVVDRLKSIAIATAKRIGACAIMHVNHAIYIDPEYDITKASLDQLNKEYLEGK